MTLECRQCARHRAHPYNCVRKEGRNRVWIWVTTDGWKSMAESAALNRLLFFLGTRNITSELA